MLGREVRWTWLGVSCVLLLGAGRPAHAESAAGGPPAEDLLWEWERGSGDGPPLPHEEELLHIFYAADSPFATQTPPHHQPPNCTQRFWLPSASAGCWEDVAGPEEFARSRLLVLQNRAALQAVATSSGPEVEKGVSYAQQVSDALRGVVVDHRSMAETMDSMQRVFTSAEEERREGLHQKVYLSMREHFISASHSIHGREQTATHLEHQFSRLETSLLNMQHRLNKILTQ